MPTLAAVDVGSLANIGWWRTAGARGAGGTDLDELIGLIAKDLETGSSVGLGFEAPLSIPRPRKAGGLNRQRDGERGRPWCAGAGTGALAMGLQQMTYVLSNLASQLTFRPAVSLDPIALRSSVPTVVVWEAFVSGRGKSRNAENTHVADARLAVEEFAARQAAGVVHSDITDTEVLSLAGVALLVSGLSEDLDLLRQPCTVVRAPDLTVA